MTSHPTDEIFKETSSQISNDLHYFSSYLQQSLVEAYELGRNHSHQTKPSHSMSSHDVHSVGFSSRDTISEGKDKNDDNPKPSSNLRKKEGEGLCSCGHTINEYVHICDVLTCDCDDYKEVSP